VFISVHFVHFCGPFRALFEMKIFFIPTHFTLSLSKGLLILPLRQSACLGVAKGEDG